MSADVTDQRAVGLVAGIFSVRSAGRRLGGFECCIGVGVRDDQGNFRRRDDGNKSADQGTR